MGAHPSGDAFAVLPGPLALAPVSAPFRQETAPLLPSDPPLRELWAQMGVGLSCNRGPWGHCCGHFLGIWRARWRSHRTPGCGEVTGNEAWGGPRPGWSLAVGGSLEPPIFPKQVVCPGQGLAESVQSCVARQAPLCLWFVVPGSSRPLPHIPGRGQDTSKLSHGFSLHLDPGSQKPTSGMATVLPRDCGFGDTVVQALAGEVALPSSWCPLRPSTVSLSPASRDPREGPHRRGDCDHSAPCCSSGRTRARTWEVGGLGQVAPRTRSWCSMGGGSRRAFGLSLQPSSVPCPG